MNSNNNTKQSVQPKLRFPEFRDAGGWEVKPLGELCQITNGKSNAQDHVEDGIYPLFDRSAEIKKSNKFLFSGEAVIIPGEGMRFVPKYYNGKYDLHQRAYTLRCFLDCGKFIFYSMDFTQEKLASKAVLSTVLSLRLPILENFYIPVPSKPAEQHRIADCLSSLDDVIAAEGQKLDALRQHKKGLMQELFPAEGETLPKRRFPEFRDAPEWEETLLGEVCKFVRGPFGGALKKEIFVEEGYAVYEQMHAIHQDFKSFRYYIDEDKFNELKRFSVLPRDLIMSCSGTMGKFAIVPDGAKQGVINQALLKLSIKKNYNLQFIKEILELPNNQEQLLSQAGGGAIKNVASVEQIKGIKFYIPIEDEQKKIADCLSSLDALIITQSQKLDTLRQHKKGLMQLLFPAAHEVQE